MRRSGADPDDLLWLRDELAASAREVEDVSRDVGRALSTFVGSSSEYVPDLPAHETAIASLDRGVDGLGKEAVDAARRLVGADGRLLPAWLPGVDASGRYRVGIGGYVDAWFQIDDARTAGVVVDASSRLATAELRLARLSNRWGSADTIPMRRYREVTNNPVGVANNRTLTPLKRQQELRNLALRSDLGDAAARNGDRLTRLSPLAAEGDGVAAVAARSTGFRNVAQLGKRALGPAGVVWSGGQAVQHAMDGEWADGAADAASAVGGALMLTGFPPAQVAGAVLTVGALAWDHRESIGGAASWVADGAKRILDGLF